MSEFEKAIGVFTVTVIVIMILTSFAAALFKAPANAKYNITGEKPQYVNEKKENTNKV